MHAPAHALLEGFKSVISLPVQWGDQDAFQHVNNTVYLRWFESSRISYCDVLALSKMYRELGIGPIMASITCHYRKPVVYPDTVHIGAKVTRIGRTSFTMEHQVASSSQNALVADGASTIVLFDYKAQKPHPLPQDVRDAISKIEGTAF